MTIQISVVDFGALPHDLWLREMNSLFNIFTTKCMGLRGSSRMFLVAQVREGA